MNLIDRLAAWWIDWRLGRTAKRISTDTGIELKAVTLQPDEWRMDVIAPNLGEFIHEATAMLNAQHAENYIQFDMLPRLDRTGARPVRVTIQWATGESPAEQNARLRDEVAQLRAALAGEVHHDRPQPRHAGRAAERAAAPDLGGRGGSSGGATW